MAGKTKPGKPVKGINIKLKMINDLIDVTGSAKDSWNPAEISDDMKAIAYIHDLADTWNPAQLNEALKYLGFATIDSWNPAIIEETKNKLVKYFLPTDAFGNPIELDLKGVLPYEVTALTIDLLPIQDTSGGDPSPENICPISGRTEVNLTVADAETSPTQTETYTETLGQTVYGGKVDFVSGGATSNMAICTVNNLTNLTRVQTSTSGVYRWVGTLSPTSSVQSSDTDGYISSKLSNASANDIYSGRAENGVLGINTTAVYIRYDEATTTEELLTAIGDCQICYKLATPIELTLTPEEISLLNGNNILTTDGDNINITYRAILNS